MTAMIQDWRRGLEPRRLPVPLRAARQLPAEPADAGARVVGRGARGAAADARPAQHRRWPRRSTSATRSTSIRSTSRRSGGGWRWRRAPSPTASAIVHAGPLYDGMTLEGEPRPRPLPPRRRRAGARHGATGSGFIDRRRRRRSSSRRRRSIDGDTIVVSSPEVAAPVAVRYALGGRSGRRACATRKACRRRRSGPTRSTTADPRPRSLDRRCCRSRRRAVEQGEPASGQSTAPPSAVASPGGQHHAAGQAAPARPGQERPQRGDVDAHRPLERADRRPATATGASPPAGCRRTSGGPSRSAEAARSRRPARRRRTPAALAPAGRRAPPRPRR